MSGIVTRVGLETDPKFQAAHDRGVALSAGHDTEQAREVFGELISDLENRNDPASKLHLARVIRDFGFTFVRDGIEQKVPEKINEALLNLEVSINEIDRIRFIRVFSPDASGYLYAELGASQGLIARALTAKGLLELDTPPYSARVLATDDTARAQYHVADRTLHLGDNSYYATSNAINAFRHNIAFSRAFDTDESLEIEGKKTQYQLPTFGWLARSAGYAAMAGLVDRGNAHASLRTVGSRLAVFKGVKAARKSVLERP